MPTNTPKPVVVTTICSLCGLDWERHGAEPTTEDCIRLLKAELASRPMPTLVIRDRYPYVQPWIAPSPWWSGSVRSARYDCSTTSAQVDIRTPAPAAISCSSVEA